MSDFVPVFKSDPDRIVSTVGKLFGMALLAETAEQYGYPLPSTPSCCFHRNAVPVTLTLTSEVVARLCPDCDEQLPAQSATS